MPDLRPFETYQSQMLVLEGVYRLKVRGAYRRSRTQLLESFISAGHTSPFLTPIFMTEFERLDREVQQIGVEIAPALQARATRYATRMLRLIRKFDRSVPIPEELPPPPPLNMRIGSVVAFQGQMISVLSRIQSESPEAAAGQLFATVPFQDRVSLFTQAVSTAQSDVGGSFWGQGNSVVDYYTSSASAESAQKIQKQVIAAIDERTTNCCLQAHGQIRDEGEPFVLTGTPRYASEIQNPPFHWYCRTAPAPYIPEFEELGITTGEMVGAAKEELKARLFRGREEIHPASATSRRR